MYLRPLAVVGFSGPATSVCITELANDGEDRNVLVPIERAGCA